MTIDRILVTLDGSSLSGCALRYTADLTETLGAQIAFLGSYLLRRTTR